MEKRIIKTIKEMPGLKARRIAKIIEEDRKEVSKFLHSTPKAEQDENFCWFYKCEKNDIYITLDSEYWITPSILENYLSKSNITKKTNKITIIFNIKTKILFSAIARILSFSHHHSENGTHVEFHFQLSSNIFTYLGRSNFFSLLHEKVEVLPKRPSSIIQNKYKGNNKSLMEFTNLDPLKRPNDTPIKIFNDISSVTDQKNWPIYTFITELYNNVYEHAFPLSEDNKKFGFIAYQGYQRNNQYHIQVVISDNGNGICSTLRPALKTNPSLNKFEKHSDIELITALFSLGEISRYNPATDPGHGLGLKKSADNAKKLNATILLRQSNFEIIFKWENESFQVKTTNLNLTEIKGTNICFDFYVD